MITVPHLLTALALFGTALSAPSLTARQSSWQDPNNQFAGRVQYVNKAYADNLKLTAAAFRQEGDETNARRAEKIGTVASTFNWYASVNAQSYFYPRLAEARAAQQASGQKLVFPLVIYNMPDRDCSSEASNGELQFNKGGLARYSAMIDTIARSLDEYKDLTFAISLEPDSIANMVTNIGNNRCVPELFEQYIAAYAYAIRALQRPHIGIYIDVAHSQWLGWPDNVVKTVDVVERIMTAAGPSAKVRGYSSNVSNYNPYKWSGNVTSDNPNYDEFRYAQSFSKLAGSKGLPTQFVVDTGRSGQQGALKNGVWCNLKGAGYGPRPSSETGEGIVDALVWIKPPGDSDGSSVRGGPGYDPSCAGADNLTPSPQAGLWFVEYSKMLVRNANPPIEL